MYSTILKTSEGATKAWQSRAKAAPKAQPKADHMQVADTILSQYGGHMFRIMTGAKNFAGVPAKEGEHGPGLVFQIPKAYHGKSRGVTHITTHLDGDDTYTVTMHGPKKSGGLKSMEVLNKTKGLYAEDLKKHFSTHTGLATHM